MSLDGLDCYLSLNYVPAPWTLVEGIEKLLPGQWLEWRRGAGQHRAVLASAAGQYSNSDPQEAAEAELDRLLKQSVREHLQSDVPLGVWLSGGLDSSSLVHYAAQESALASEDVFHHVSRTKLRRSELRTRSSRAATEPSTPNSI